MSAAPLAPVRPEPTTRRTPRMVIISAWAVPVLIVGGFAMVAILPVLLVLAGTLRDARLRALRWWSVALAAAYATPLALWAIGPDRAPSLTKDMSPVLAAVIIAVSVAVIVAYYVIGRRSSRAAA